MNVVGFIVHRPPGAKVPLEPFYREIVAGLEDVLLPAGYRVLMQIVSDDVEELTTYQRWAATSFVDGVVVANLQPEDKRPALLRELGLPAVIIGELDDVAPFSVVRTDNTSAMRQAVRRLVELGHRRIAHVTGPSQFLHTQRRMRAFEAEVATLDVSGRQVEADYTPAGGLAATRTLLADPQRPTAIVYDNDVMAIAANEAADDLGIRVPEQVSLLAWDDSMLCRLADPAVSAMSHDVVELGALAGEALLGSLRGKCTADTTAPEPTFLARGTTAAPPVEDFLAVSAGGATWR
ncbi:LacI family DNA-binding transcriptional regulator [Curtobacterium sp. MWU13-2055]|uniref:LacI family DNA-binding transcriptional regulator n=1 Tax=Curtobacterium sp. MWU13-2055 TaxID=2931928 RepID=UPI00200BF952|nr:substrate-binding domain-containing protein [Curtobacterium sp. MWU13-2055]